MKKLLLALILAAMTEPSCSAAQNPRVAAAIQEGRVILHATAVGLCMAHTIGQPLIILAEGAYPVIRMIAPIADSFCAQVQREQTAVADAARRVTPAGVDLVVAPTYTVTPTSYTVSW